jgi:hypothetical protein
MDGLGPAFLSSGLAEMLTRAYATKDLRFSEDRVLMNGEMA